MAIDPGRLKAIFLAAVETPDRDSRLALLERECGDDLELRRRLDVLLAAHDEPAALVVAPSHAQKEGGVKPLEALDQIGQILAGRYKLLERIGEGGMGAVWVADQLQPVRRKVAIKLIKAGMDTHSVLSRFEAERQALAVMDHPNIAKVLDGGMTESGRPFFVMEYVKGLPFNQYCDEFRLSIVDRLKLFVPVCQAVQHAHQKGIIHRDLKPSNILICMYDGRPIPKVIDFGLAKAFNQPLTDRTVYTAHGIMLGTPTYMSPEQAEFNNLDIDTRADVYSLGVVLYESLTGSTPLEQQRFREMAWLEMLRLIKEEEPPKPSERLSGSGSLPSVAAQRHIEPEKLTRLVKGELDWIVMKCLEKDRSRRYESADGLACDVERFLNDEIVMARPPSAIYRWKKFFRRNRSRVIAATMVFLALILGLAGTLLSLAEAQRQTRQANIARDNEAKLRTRAEKAESAALEKEQRARELAESEQAANQTAQQRLSQIEKASRILQQVFRELNPQAAGKVGELLEASLAERLDFAAQALDSESIGDALTVARVQVTLGVTYLGLGFPRKAIALLEKAGPTLLASLGEADPESLVCQFNLAECLAETGQRSEALAIHNKVLEIRRKSLDSRNRDYIHSLAAVGECHRRLGNLKLAKSMIAESLELCNEVLAADDLLRATILNNLGMACMDAGQNEEALTRFVEVLALQKELRGDDHPETLNAMNNLGVCKGALGKLDEELKLTEEAFEKQSRRLGPWHPTTLSSMNNLASIWHKKGQLDKSILLYTELLEKKNEVLGPDHPSTCLTAANLATTYRDAKRLEEAVPLLQRAFVASKTFPELEWVEPHLAECLRDLGREEEAINMFKDLIAEAKQRFPDPSIELAGRLNRLGWLIVVLQLDSLDEAERAIRQSLSIREHLAPDSWLTFSSRAALGAVLLRLERFEEAESLLVSGFEGMEQRADSIPDRVRRGRLRESLEFLVELYQDWNKADQAAVWQQRLDSFNTKSAEPVNAK